MPEPYEEYELVKKRVAYHLLPLPDRPNSGVLSGCRANDFSVGWRHPTLLAVQLKITEPLATGASSVTIKFLAMDPNDKAQVVLPAQHTQEDVVEVSNLYII